MNISIVTPSFNQGEYIEQTIDSVLSQNYPGLEYIIIDGGSTDRSIEIIKKYASHLTFWVSESDQGQSDAINKGLKHVTGDIFNWINSDDYYEPDVFLKVNHYFSELNCDLVCGREWVFNEKHRTRELKPGSTVKPKLEETIQCAHIDQPCTFWRTSVFKDLSPLNQSFNFLMDAEIWVRYLLIHGQNKIAKVDDVLTNFRLHEDSKTESFQEGFMEERNELMRQIYNLVGVKDFIIDKLWYPNDKAFIDLFGDLSITDEIDKSYFLSYSGYETYGIFFSSGEFKKASKAFTQYLKYGHPELTLELLKFALLIYLAPKSILNRYVK